MFRPLAQVALAAILLLGFASGPALTCDAQSAQGERFAGEGKQPENRATRDKCKKANGSRNVPKGCPDGGERLPNENKRSPLDDAPPLTPLVA